MNMNVNEGTDAAGGNQEPDVETAVNFALCDNRQCIRRTGILTSETRRLIDRVQELEEENALLQGRNAGLARRIEGLQEALGRRGKHTKRTWPDVLRRYLQGASDPNAYANIYKLCCREENMSTRLHWIHPDIRLVAPRADLRNQSASEHAGRETTLATLAPDRADDVGKHFPFEKLPLLVQEKILKMLLYKEGQLIHCISRLDPFVEPPPPGELDERKSGLINRFYFGSGSFNITNDSVDPGKFLSILAVNKRLCFLGVHIFYGLNTLAFSSLGELGRFCQGSGRARVARIQHMELLLTGNMYLTAPPDERQKVPFSRRTYPLTWFTDACRLKTLVVHINETGKGYVRRGYENPMMKQFMAAKTAGQPNCRISRSLRCVQGIDYIYQLRGMDWIRFYDFNKALMGLRNVRKPIQDWSFAEDITNTTTLPKVPTRLENAKLENLESLFPRRDGGPGRNWKPSDADWELVKSLYLHNNGRSSYDDLRRQALNHDADLASYLSVARNSRLYDDSASGASEHLDSDSDPASRETDNRSESPLFVDPVGIALASDTDTDVDAGDDADADAASDAPSSGMDLDLPSNFDDSSPDTSDSGSDSDGDNDNDNDSNNGNDDNDTPPTPHTQACATNTYTNTNARRESTATSGLFVTPAPGDAIEAGEGGWEAREDVGNHDMVLDDGSESDNDGDVEGGDSDSDEDGDDDDDARRWLSLSGINLDLDDDDSDDGSDTDAEGATERTAGGGVSGGLKRRGGTVSRVPSPGAKRTCIG
ncbi:hypothetical protein MFIFM68171_06240 [Madurella fahalii]|uniref:Uncharacterized protein n=1 Tax=Madurella fahalii TaxID=1157608 RepID=A0ABQ0GEB9_9PEZI